MELGVPPLGEQVVTPQVGGLGSSGILDSVKEVAPLFTLRG